MKMGLKEKIEEGKGKETDGEEKGSNVKRKKSKR